MVSKRDYYEILGVAKDADDDVLKKAYRKLAMQYHPDRNVGDAEAEIRFKEVQESFEILRDPEKRRVYDRYGHTGLEQMGGGRSNADPRSFFDSIFGSSGIFGQMFNEQRSASGVVELETEIELDLMEAARGCRKKIAIQRSELCAVCGGSGAKRGSNPERCKRCQGRGEIYRGNSFIAIPTTCPDCGGSGAIIKEKCPECKGATRKFVPFELEVDVPAGVDTGDGRRLEQMGHAGVPGRPRGDLLCVFKVKPHDLFIRKGPHLICRVPITFSQAALGGQIEIPTLDGPKIHHLERGIQANHELHFRGLGMPSLRSRQKGDLVVVLVIETPRTLTRRQEELFRELAELDQKHVQPEQRGFLDRLRSFFSGNSMKKDGTHS